ncbi:MAG: 2-C-methyl-D-erythritol 2,4-cyclodiphosphate synthase [bacterium]|nr:2-C-methyl-D-erythritol 2,4-cyclodiphosphate synthase [bacterium]
MRVGFGYDFHRLVEGKPLIIGGVKIPWSKGLLGHSDGDALSHAIGDAILGASGKRDIGTYFPDCDPKYKGISSLILLQKIMKIAKVEIINVDSVIICESPKLSSYILAIRKKIAKTLDVSIRCISIKAKTNEGVGPIGKGEGIAAYAIIFCQKKLDK